jgi:hypothetical protein
MFAMWPLSFSRSDKASGDGDEKLRQTDSSSDIKY